MKKFFASLLLFTVLASGAFAVERNWGFGVGPNRIQTSGTFDGSSWNMSRFGTCAFLFFGLSRYLELNAGFIAKDADGITIDGRHSSVFRGYSSALQAGAYGKFPFSLGSRFDLFPTAGVDFEFALESDWWNEIWLRGGVGADVFLGERFFIRGHVLFGYGFPFGGDPALNVKSSTGMMGKIGLGWMF